MVSKLKSAIFIVLILLNIQMYGQEMLGLGFSNYSGISGKNINPAFLTGSKVYLDINVVGAGLSVENNFAYLPNQNGNIWTILHGDTLPQVYGSYAYNGYFTYHPNKPYYSGSGMATIMGPGVMLQYGKQAFGISISVRNYESAYRLPGPFIQDLYNHGIQSGSAGKNELKNIGAASLGWAELSFNYAYDFYERYGTKLTGGIELKVLYGVEGAYSEIHTLKYHSIGNNELTIDTLNATVGMAMPVNYSTANADLNPWHKGHGLGFSIGFTYTKELNSAGPKEKNSFCANPYQDYKYRIGLSILDVGSIRFKNNTRLYQIQAQNVTIDPNQINIYTNVDATMNTLLNQFQVDTTKALVDSTMRMSLPSALSLQMDYRLRKNIYVSGFWIHPLRFSKKSLRRPAELAVIPRYDTRWVGVSMPVSLFDYQQLRLGMALRIYSVTIGTEKLGTLLGFGKLDGLDAYFDIKFNLEKGKCLSWKKSACEIH